MLNINKELYNYLINDLGAYFEQHQDEVRSNVDNTEKENKWYLGTYFPKTYKESYEIFRDILVVMNKYGFFDDKEEINILDIGSGTGGEIFGMLQSFEENISKSLIINIYSVDGNENALEIQGRIYNFWKNDVRKHKVNIVFIQQRFSNIETMKNNIIGKFANIKMNIILTFKFLSEMIRYDNEVYLGFLKIMENLLDEDGFLVLEDITCKTDKTENSIRYVPSIIYDNIKKYIKNTDILLDIILPLCCANNIERCNKNNCYTQCITNSQIYKDNKDIAENIDCKFNYNLFIKKGRIENNINKMISYLKEKCEKECIFSGKEKECYCSRAGAYTGYFSEKKFYNTQFSLVNIIEMYNEYNKI